MEEGGHTARWGYADRVKEDDLMNLKSLGDTQIDGGGTR